jgi:hypothetical protein
MMQLRVLADNKYVTMLSMDLSTVLAESSLF